jgi:hypothetical protein
MDTATTSTSMSGNDSGSLLESLKKALSGAGDAGVNPNSPPPTNPFGQVLTPQLKQQYANFAEQAMSRIPMGPNYGGMPIQQGYSSETSAPQWAQYS